MGNIATEIQRAIDTDKLAARRTADAIMDMLYDFIPTHSRSPARDRLGELALKNGFELTTKALRKEYEAHRESQLEVQLLRATVPGLDVSALEPKVKPLDVSALEPKVPAWPPIEMELTKLVSWLYAEANAQDRMAARYTADSTWRKTYTQRAETLRACATTLVSYQP